MKNTQLIIAILSISLVFSSCKKEEIEDIQPSANTIKIENLYAPGDEMDQQTGEIISIGSFIYFDFSKGEEVNEDELWDIAFKGTEIIVNGGVHGNNGVVASVVVNTYNELIEAPSDNTFRSDTEILNAIPLGSGNGWYNYNPTNHLISPVAGRVLVFKTTEGNYAKMEILNYYKNAPANPDPMMDLSNYYTFNFAYQSNGTTKF